MSLPVSFTLDASGLRPFAEAWRSAAAILVFTAGAQGYFIVRSRLWESAALILVAFTLFRPGFWMDLAVAPYDQVEPTSLVETLERATPGTELRATVSGMNDVGDPITLTMMIPVGSEATGDERLEAFGLMVFEQDGKLIVDGTAYDSPAQQAGFDFDQVFETLDVPTAQPPRQLFYIPALLLLGLIYLLQRGRKRQFVEEKKRLQAGKEATA